MRKICFFIFILIGTIVYAISGYHNVPVVSGEGENLDIEISFLKMEKINKVVLYYRYDNQIIYDSYVENLDEEKLNLNLTMPIKTSKEFGIEYYIMIFFEDGTVQSYPENNPNLNPYKINVYKSSDNVNKSVFFVAPQDNYCIEDSPLNIVVSLYNIIDKVDKNSIKLVINGKEIKPDRIAGSLVLLKLEKLPNGELKMYVRGSLINGEKFSSPPKYMRVRSKERFDYKKYVRGSFVYNGFFKSFDYESDDKIDKKSTLNFKASGSYDFLHYKGLLFLSSRESRYKQAINRYSLSLSIPYFKTVLGDYSPNYGDFIFKNSNVRGFHANVDTKYFRFYTSFGNKNRSVEGKKVDNKIVRNAVFSRNTMGFRTEVGYQKNFQWGLSFVKNKDDVDSVDKEFTVIADSTYSVAAKDNIALGTDFLLFLLNNKLELGLDFATSLVNRNIVEGSLTEDELEDYGISLPFNPEDVEDFMVINTNLEPFEPSINSSAIKTYAKILLGKQFVRLGFSQIGSSYTSLSSGYLANDYRTFDAVSQLSLLQDKLILSFNFRYSIDNIAGEKMYSTESLNFGTNVFYVFNQDINIRGMISTFGISDDKDKEKLIDQNNITYQLGYNQRLHNIDFADTYVGLTYVGQLLNDDGYSYSVNKNDFFSRKSEVIQNSVTLFMNNKFRNYPVSTNVSYTLSSTEANDENFIGNDDRDSTINSFLIGSEFRYLEDKLCPFVRYKFSSYTEDNSPIVNVFILGTKWEFLKNTDLVSSFDLNSYNSDSSDDNTVYSFKLKVNHKF